MHDIKLRPQIPIERAVIDGFLKMHRLDRVAVVEVGNGPGDTKHFVVRPGGEAKLVHRRFQNVLAFLIERAELPRLAMRHVGVVPGVRAVESQRLMLPRRGDLVAQVGARRARRPIRQFLERDGWHFNVDVDPIEQRATTIF